MLARRIGASGAERIFMIMYNSYSTASLTNGQAVQIDYATDANGVSVTKPAAGNKAGGKHAGFAFAGIAAETIAAGAYGLIQVYGYHSAVRARTTTGGLHSGTPAVAAGVPLTLKSTVFCLESYDLSNYYTSTVTIQMWAPCALSLGATAGFTTAAIAAFIKAM